MDAAVNVHHDFAYIAITVNALAGIWTLFGLKFITIKRKKYFYIPTYVGWACMGLQALLGISLYMSNHRVPETKSFHYFYGFLTLIILGFLYGYMRTFGNRKAMIFGISSIFIAAMALRSSLLVLMH